MRPQNELDMWHDLNVIWDYGIDFLTIFDRYSMAVNMNRKWSRISGLEARGGEPYEFIVMERK